MKYLSPEELKTHDVEIRNRLNQFSGPAVRHGFSLDVFKRYIFEGDQQKRFLDCGIASGGFLRDLYEAGFKNLYGVDIADYINPENRKLVKEFKTADLSFNKLDWPDNYFRAMTGWCLLPHLENPHNFIREAYRVLEPGGYLIVSTINVAATPNRKYFYHNGNFPAYHTSNNHIYIFTPAIIDKSILKYFKLIGTEYFITPRIFNGIRGRLRRILHKFVSRNPKWKNWLNDRWGAKVVYIFQKEKPKARLTT